MLLREEKATKKHNKKFAVQIDKQRKDKKADVAAVSDEHVDESDEPDEESELEKEPAKNKTLEEEGSTWREDSLEAYAQASEETKKLISDAIKSGWVRNNGKAVERKEKDGKKDNRTMSVSKAAAATVEAHAANPWLNPQYRLNSVVMTDTSLGDAWFVYDDIVGLGTTFLNPSTL